MIAKLMWEGTLQRIRTSRPLQVLAAVCVLDYLGYLWLAASERMNWSFTFALFLFSTGCWFWAVTWPPFWNRLTFRFQSPGTRNFLSFLDRCGIVTLFFVQAAYSAMLVAYVCLHPWNP
ncbi:MAG: hypothetical protein MUC63_06365 [Planctomycetes bacterium]|jgi:hypothetical protein|nr:hypothetical protein [Planctomycetota bacterium]